jgi:hypothetical protein
LTASTSNPEGKPPRRSQLKALLENWMERAEDCAEKSADPVAASGHAELSSLVRLAAVFGFLCRTKNAVLRSDEWNRLRDQIEAAARARLGNTDTRAALSMHLSELGKRLERELAETERGHAALMQRWSREALGRGAQTRTRSSDAGQSRIDAIRLAERFDEYLLASAAIAAFAARPPGSAADESLQAVHLARASALCGEMFDQIAAWFFAMEKSVDPAYLPSIAVWDLPDAPEESRILFASGRWISGTAGRIRYYRQEVADAKRADAAAQFAASLWRADADQPRTEAWRTAAKQVRKLASSDSRVIRLFETIASAATPRLAAARSRSRDAGQVTLQWAAPDGLSAATCMLGGASDQAELVLSFFDGKGNLARQLDGEVVSWCGVTAVLSGGRARFSTAALLVQVSPKEFAQRGTMLSVGTALWTARFQGLLASLETTAPDVPEGDEGDVGDVGDARGQP